MRLGFLVGAMMTAGGVMAAACGGPGSTTSTPVAANANVAMPGGSVSAKQDNMQHTDTDNVKPVQSGGPNNVVTNPSNSPIQFGNGNTQNNIQNVSPVPDRCAHHRIRNKGTYDACVNECNRQRDEGHARAKDGPGHGGVDNAANGCVAGCAGSQQAAARDGCYEDR